MSNITTIGKLRCAERELKIRRRVYPRWQAQGYITKQMADREIEVMSAIVDDYSAAAEKERLI